MVFDIDGVLADVSHRLHHLAKKPKDWNAFFSAAPADPPLPQGIELARQLAQEHKLAYVTGRPERLRRPTIAWLERHDLPRGRLFMRRSGDFRPARSAKVDVLRDLHRTSPVHVVVDDDAAVVAAMKDAGFSALHATWAITRPELGSLLEEAQERDGRT